MANKVNARILISVGDSRKGIEFENIDFDRSRNQIAQALGRTVIDVIFDLAEKEGQV